MPDVVIEVRDLTKTYILGDNEVRALRGVSLTIERGEFVAIMGASGSGKSTLMNVIGCLDLPTSGKYLLEGVDVASLTEPELAGIRSRRIGFVFQSFNLLTRTSAIENVELPLLYSGDLGKSVERARASLKLLGLEGRERNHSNQLSGGQQQRVAIARSLINDPAILLADEPTGNLDSVTSTDIMTTLQRLNIERGVTVILVTHDAEVAEYADRVITLRDGVIVSDHREASRHRGAAAIKESTAAPTDAASTATVIAAADKESVASQRFGIMALRAAGRALARNKLRSALTMLGIFIGVAALIAMVAVGQGANQAVKEQIASLGTNLLIVLPGAVTSSGVRNGYGTRSTLRAADAEAISKEDSAVLMVSYMDRQTAQVENNNQNWSTTINGVTPSYTGIRAWPVVSGREFTDEDERSAALVCILGNTVVQNLFGEHQDPIGTTIRVKNVQMKVVGVLATKGQSGMGQDQDDVVLIPFTTAERKVLGVAAPTAAAAASTTATLQDPYATTPNSTAIYNASTTVISPFGAPPKMTGVVQVIFAEARSEDLLPDAIKQITDTIHRRHHIQPGKDNDFDIRNLSEIAKAAESSSHVMALLLAAVASISLLVGGIGIMNILLVSVTERTREIGIRMAIGARRTHILLQFLVESVLLSAIGGVVGILAGVGASQAISALAGWPTLLSWDAVIGGFLFSAAVGIFFGYYPARKASMLNPIDALRYE
ncbi:MAG TPA: ABC transporter permease [Candidatus Binataceae bacterium]|nr:ABC transporter permease [Candidatus Binataceae bacterium]